MPIATKTVSGLMGLCVGDALGVPVEFTSRAELVKSPVTSMRGYGNWFGRNLLRCGKYSFRMD